jgi:acetyltransferase-like isoleucine patch superfamily enzyme
VNIFKGYTRLNIIFFYFFLVLNFLNFQYVPGLRGPNNLLTKLRMFFLRLAGARIGNLSIIRPNCLLVSAKNIIVGTNSIIGAGSKIMNFEYVTIGDNVEIGPNASFQTNEHVIENYDAPLGKQGAKYLPILVGSGCYIGADVSILSGVQIADNCIIGAKSLVTKNLEMPGLYAGCPARLIKEFPSEK